MNKLLVVISFLLGACANQSFDRDRPIERRIASNGEAKLTQPAWKNS